MDDEKKVPGIGDEITVRGYAEPNPDWKWWAPWRQRYVIILDQDSVRLAEEIIRKHGEERT